MITEVVTNVHFFNFTVFGLAFNEHFFEKFIEDLLSLNLGHIGNILIRVIMWGNVQILK